MFTNEISVPPTVAMDAGFMAGVGASWNTEWLNGGTFGPIDHKGYVTTYSNSKDFILTDTHCKRLNIATSWLIETYSPLCGISPTEWVIAVEMFEGIGGLRGVVTSRLAHQYAGYWQGKGYNVKLVSPRKAGALYRKNGNGDICQWTDAYTKILCGKRPKYGHVNHLGQKVLLLPNDDSSNRRIHEQATRDIAVYAETDPLGKYNQVTT